MSHPRVVGIDPGTVSIDVCGIEGETVFLDQTLPTREALADPAAIIALLRRAAPLDCIVGPSGYGLPLVPAAQVTETDLHLAFLAAPGETGGIGGLTALARALIAAELPVVFIPGVIHLETVPTHRKINRIDLGTPDKVCATALAVLAQRDRRGCALEAVSLILVELGGAFTAAVAVDAGRIVDGVGGSSGPLGFRAAGAWDGEVAALAGHVTKSMLFGGGVTAIRGDTPSLAQFATPETARETTAWEAYLEGIAKTVAALAVSVPAPAEIVLSGRLASADPIRDACVARLRSVAPVTHLEGRVRRVTGASGVSGARQAATGAALIADGLAGGTHRDLVDRLGIRTARGSALDYLVAITPDTARRGLGIA